MSTSSRIWEFLPGFLKRKEDGVLSTIISAIQEALNELKDFLTSLKQRGLSLPSQTNIFVGEGITVGDGIVLGQTYNEADITLIGLSRGLAPYPWESIPEFGERVHVFPVDSLYYGTIRGIKRELERTRLHVDGIFETGNDPQRWILLSLADQAQLPEEQISHIFALGEEDENVRGIRIYRGYDDIFSFTVSLSNPDYVEYSKSAVKSILKTVKPAYTVGFVYFPGSTYAEEVR